MKKYTLSILLFSCAVWYALPTFAQENPPVKKEKRIVIIKTNDSTGRDTIEINVDSEEEDIKMVKLDLKPATIVSSSNLNFGFCNVNKGPDILLKPLPYGDRKSVV